MKLTFIVLLLMLVGCSQPNEDYFPLGEKIQWEYHFQKHLGNNQSEGKSIIAQLPYIQANGHRYFPYRYANGETLYYSKNETGIFRNSQPEQKERIFLKTPFALNSHWIRETRIELLNNRHESFSGGESFISQGEQVILHNKVVSFDDTITVPAGVFRNSLRVVSSASVEVLERTRGIEQIQIEQTAWYAKGVGLIKCTRREYSIPEKYDANQVTELMRVTYY